MKCMQNPVTGEIVRVTDKEAKRLYSYGWKYIPKEVWKKLRVKALAKA